MANNISEETVLEYLQNAKEAVTYTKLLSHFSGHIEGAGTSQAATCQLNNILIATMKSGKVLKYHNLYAVSLAYVLGHVDGGLLSEQSAFPLSSSKYLDEATKRLLDERKKSMAIDSGDKLMSYKFIDDMESLEISSKEEPTKSTKK